METQIGTMVTGDFEDNTMTFEIDGKMTLAAGKYAIVPIKAHEKLVKNLTIPNVIERFKGLQKWYPYHDDAGIEWEEDNKDGEWVKIEDVRKLIEGVKENDL